MSKVYCQGCFAEIPDYAHFCHLCGAPQPGDLAHDNGGSTPPTPPLASKPFDTEFAPASVGNPHSDDATLPVSRATFQTNSSANNSSSVASPARLDDAYLDTPPLVPAVSPWQTSSSPINAVSAPGNEEYSDPYYAALHTKEELDEIAAQSTILVRKDNLILPLPIQASSPQRAAHQQPQMLRAAHQQPQMLRASHQQLQSIHVVHKQPVRSMRTFFATHAQPARYSLVGMCVVLLVGLAVLLTNPFSSTNAQVNVLLSPTLTTMNATNAFPGGSITLHGINFTPGAVVAFSADGSNLSLASAQPSVSPANSANVSSLADIVLSARSALLQKAALDARVQDDGTFNIALSIPQSWQANSTHRIQAKESSSGKIAFVDVKVLAQKYVAPKTVPGPTPQATSAPPPQQTQAVAPNPPSAPQQAVAPNPTQAPKPTPKPVSSNPVVQQPQAPEPTPTPYVAPQPPATPEHKPFCLSVDNDSLAFRATLRGSDPDGQIVSLSDDAACASGDWSASSDSPWLSVSPSWGHIPSGKNALIDVGTSIADLKPGSYTGHITLSPGSNVITVSLHVQVAATCISAQSSELGFTSNASYSDYSEGGWTVQQPVDKVATIENGGDCDAGSWTVTSDAKWLTVTPGTGKIDRGGSSTATVHVSAVGLNVNTPYTGHLTFDAGSSKATITVTLKFVLENQSVTPTVTPPEICLAAQTSALYFSSNVDASGPNQPKDQPATVVNGNCGAGNWTVSSDVPWLSAKGGGYIEANGTGDATVHVAPNRLDTSKEYTGHLIFVAGSSKVTIPVYLSFTIESPTPTPEQPTPAPVKPTPIPEQPTAITQPTPIPVKPTPVPVEPTPVPVPPTPIPVKPTPVPPALTQCLSVDQASLAFNGAIGYKGYDPQAQTITVTNCGSVGLVTAAVSNDSLGWLAASGGGQIASGAKTYISVSVDAIRSGLKPGPHSGIVYITVKTSDGNTKNVAVSVSFNVTATVQPAPTPVPQPTPTPVPVEPTPTPVPQPQPTPTPQPQQPQAQPTTGLRESQG